LYGHLGLGWALVDEHCALRHLDESAVALADIEERDAEAGWRRKRMVRSQLPTGENECEDGGQQDAAPPPRGRQPDEESDKPWHGAQAGESLPGGHLRVREPAEEACHRG
jgi:hypothetical protein